MKWEIFASSHSEAYDWSNDVGSGDPLDSEEEARDLCVRLAQSEPTAAWGYAPEGTDPERSAGDITLVHEADAQMSNEIE